MTNRATVGEVRRQRAFITGLDAALRSPAPGVSLRDICGQYPQESASLRDVLSAVRNFLSSPPPPKTSVTALRTAMFG